MEHRSKRQDEEHRPDRCPPTSLLRPPTQGERAQQGDAPPEEKARLLYVPEHGSGGEAPDGALPASRHGVKPGAERIWDQQSPPIHGESAVAMPQLDWFGLEREQQGNEGGNERQGTGRRDRRRAPEIRIAKAVQREQRTTPPPVRRHPREREERHVEQVVEVRPAYVERRERHAPEMLRPALVEKPEEEVNVERDALD